MCDIHSLGIQGTVLSAFSGEEYQQALHRNSDLSILEAKYVVFPEMFSDIPPILHYATSQSPPLEIAVKGGGAHSSTWASSQGGVVIDLARLNKVAFSKDNQSVTVQGGAVWGDVYEACQKAHVDVVGGHMWFVGVAGFLLGGGYSHLTAEHGLGIDNILAATVVLADGRIIKTSAREEPDLFWAIRGGGNQFGIVVDFTLKTFPSAAPFTVGSLVYPGSEIANVLKVTQEWVKTSTSSERVSLAFARAPPQFKPAVLILPWVSRDTGRSAEVLTPFRNGALKPLVDKCVAVPDLLTLSHAADATFAHPPRRLTIRGMIFSDFWTDMVLEVWARWYKFTEENEDTRSSMVIWDTGRPEKITVVRKEDAAYHARDPHYCVVIQGRSNTAASDTVTRDFVSSTVAYIRQKDCEKSGKDLGININLAQGDEAIEDVFGTNLPRMRKLKAKYDPKKLWSKGFAIEPDFD